MIIIAGGLSFYYLTKKYISDRQNVLKDLDENQTNLIKPQKDTFSIQIDSFLNIVNENDINIYKKTLDFNNEYSLIYSNLTLCIDTLIYQSSIDTIFQEIEVDTKKLNQNIRHLYSKALEILKDDELKNKYNKLIPLNNFDLEEYLILSPLAGKVTFLNLLVIKFKEIQISILKDLSLKAQGK